MRILQHGFRIYTSGETLDSVVAFYEVLQQMSCERRFDVPETGLHGAKVGHALILAGDTEALARVRYVQAIYYVDDLDGFAHWLPHHGGQILHGPRTVAAGRNFTARNPDGLIVEYFQGG